MNANIRNDIMHHELYIVLFVFFFQDGSKFNESYRKMVRTASGITEWSYAHTWNTSSTPRPVECNIAGFFEIERPCKQSLLPVNITCSKANSGNHSIINYIIILESAL